jgi:hypothetical protein
MLRVIAGVVTGFITWMVVWIGIEKILSGIFPVAYGVPQKAFEMAIKNGGAFTPDSTLLLGHIVIVTFVAALSGFVASKVASGSQRAPMVLAFVLLAVGVMKAAMTWSLVPIWYHIAFTAILVPMTILGGRWNLRPSTN